MYIDNRIEKLMLMFQHKILSMLSEKELDNYIDRLIKTYNLIPISKYVGKKSYDLFKNNFNFNILVKELDKPLSNLDLNDLENRALILYLALINPKRFHLSEEKVKEIPDIILKLNDFALEKIRKEELSGDKNNIFNNKSFNIKRSAKFFTGLLICIRNYLNGNQRIMDV